MTAASESIKNNEPASHWPPQTKMPEDWLLKLLWVRGFAFHGVLL